MSFGRVNFKTGDGLPAPLRAGDGLVANFSVATKTDDAAATLTTDQIVGGMIHHAGTLTAGRILTTPTGTLLAAAFPGMDIGDSFSFVVTNANAGAHAVTLAPGVGVTLVGSGAVPQFGQRIFVLVKTAAATFNLY